jgi:hypothetical protein
LLEIQERQPDASGKRRKSSPFRAFFYKRFSIAFVSPRLHIEQKRMHAV